MMRSKRLLALVAATWVLGNAAAVAAGTNSLARTVSLSGQIHVFTADASLSSALAAFCEDVRGKLLTRLDDHSEWRAPIAVVIRPRPAGRALPMPGERATLRTSAASVSGRLRIQIDAEAPPPLDAAQFVHAVTGALCSELANRKFVTVEAGRPLARVPSWLVTGLAARWDGCSRETTLQQVQQAIASGNLPGFEELTTSDVVPWELYRSACEVLVDMLESQPNGAVKVHEVISVLKPAENWRIPFVSTFGPAFTGGSWMEKWWALVAVRAGAMIIPQAMTAPETQRRLEAALRVVLPVAMTPKLGPGTFTLAELRSYDRKPQMLAPMLVAHEAQLQSLLTLAHPLYRPAIAHYIEAIQALRKHSLRQFRLHLVRAAAEQRQAQEKTDAITSYLGTVEARMHPEDFANRFGTWFQLGASAGGAHSGKTPVRDYLDRVESELRR